MTARTDRIDQLLREEIGAILAKDIQDPRIGFVTVTDVETAPDLSTARVWVSIIGQPDERRQTLRALEHAMPFVRRELGARIRIRRIPELLVKADDSLQRGTRVLQLLAELESGGSPENVPPPVESLPTPSPRFEADVPAKKPTESRSRGDRRAHRGAAARAAHTGQARHKPRGRR